ncbi:MAG: DUF2878 domain-containing protein [Rhodanobacter sp.]|nr:MAG: DUF2878 domain-containing protein [Rhodanobacter sp.]
MKFWISLIGYQAVWFAAVIGAGHGLAWPGVLGMLLYATWQFRVSDRRSTDLRLIAAALVMGLLLDGGLLHLGLASYAASWVAPAPPAWILALWATFALTFTQSLSYLQNKLWLAALLGSIGGPLAYQGAARGWHVVSFAQPVWPALLWLAIGWGLATPLLARLARHRPGHPASTPVSLQGHGS